jgi:hypothetical protein
MPGPDMREYLERLLGHTLPTLTGKPNRILAIDGTNVIVATRDNASGGRVSLALVQSVIDRVFDGEEVVLDPKRRSAFVGAVLKTLDGVEVLLGPRRARLAAPTGPRKRGITRWWAGLPDQRFWMEITGRTDVGTDLHAPQRDDAGNENWTYALVREVADGDVVFHYKKATSAITGWSVATGGFWEEETYWGTPRSTGPSGHPVTPYLRPGLWHGLHGPFALDQPVTLTALRDAEDELRDIYDQLAAQHRGSRLYFPVQFRRDGLRAQQGYLVKFPAEAVALFSQLEAVAGRAAEPPDVPTPVARGSLGTTYRPADEEAAQSQRDPFPVDPAVVERGVRSHAMLQNLLARHVESAGHRPKTPSPDDPLWDVLWTASDGTVWVAEVKSLTSANEERQLRLGLGQLLRYRHRLAARGDLARAVLMVEHEPSDPAWDALCSELDVILVWPDVIAARL